MTKRHRHDDDDDRPRHRKHHHGHKKKAGTPVALVVGLVVGGILLLGGGALAAILLLRDKSTQNATAEDPFPGMIAHWSFDDVPKVDEDKGTFTIRDSTGRGNTGSMTGGRLSPGRRGNALWLDGRDDQYMDVSGGKALNFADGAEFTLAAWYKTSQSHGTILAFRSNEFKTQLDLYVRTNHLLGIVGDDRDPGPHHAFIWCDVLNDGEWHHAALTRFGKTIELFYDGMSAGKDMTGNCAGPITGDLRTIGCNRKFVEDDERRFGRPGFNGGIDEVYIFSRALSAAEIQKLMRR